MKILHVVILSATCIFLLSALTGIQRLHLSTESGLTMTMHTLEGRLIAFVIGLFCAVWYSGVSRHTRWGAWGTDGVFVLIICICILQGVLGAVKADTAGGQIWSLGSQIGFAVLIFAVWRSVKRRVNVTDSKKEKNEN